jgi:hypothetical protein
MSLVIPPRSQDTLIISVTPTSIGSFYGSATMTCDDSFVSTKSVPVRLTVTTGPNDVTDDDLSIPKEFALHQNYPNPFNPATIISYQIPVHSHVELKVYNMLGREIETLVNREQNAGSYDIKFGRDNLSSGVYLYRIKAGSFIKTNKMIFLK